MRFIHCSDIHLGKTYRNSAAEKIRYEDFFLTFEQIVATAIDKQVDFVLIGGDLFHVGQILPRTFARTIQALQPLKDAGIPCVAIEGNHDWIHRRDSISWMEALSQMGYLNLLRPERTEDGGYQFLPFDSVEGCGGHLQIADLNIYGLGYIGAQAGAHVERICRAVETKNNILLFHVGIWSYSPVEIGNMKLEEAHPLAEKFGYVALGHGHKPYVVETPSGVPYAYNPGSPDRVNFGEQKYAKGYYLVEHHSGDFSAEFIATSPRPMLVPTIDLDGCDNAEEAVAKFTEHIAELLQGVHDERQPLLELKLTGRVGFHPFEMGRERLSIALLELCEPLHLEIKNHLSLISCSSSEDNANKSLAEIETDVLQELISASSEYQGQEEQLARLALLMRDLVQKGDVDGDELLALLAEDEQ